MDQDGDCVSNQPDTIVWNFKNPINYSTIPTIITILMLILILTSPYWIAIIILENLNLSQNLNDSNCKLL
jgi:hypothetical protein